jgi:cellulose synthase/poly-beta-1,6-N-acetylglucosamine synthase-like glycosyltransferase
VWIFELLYALCAVLLSLYGLNSLLLTVLYLWHRRDSPEHHSRVFIRPRGGSAQDAARLPAERSMEVAATDPEWPHVTVQLPIYNELHTAERLLAAVAALDYPRERLEIQVLDDSTDDTRSVVGRAVERLRGQGIDAVYVTRAERVGYKAGALAAGLASAKGALIAVFDADFCPEPGFLRDVVPHLDDPRVGCVQTRWGHVNRAYNPITRVQALMLDGHFVVEQTARSRAGLFTSFNGTAGVWRRACIEDAGGWSGDTLTEDLDLSYRAQLRGWRIAYLPHVVVPAELPVQIGAFKRQQARWAQGSIQTALRMIGPLIRARQPWGVKLQGAFHLTAYLAHPLMLLSVLLLLPAASLREVALQQATLQGYRLLGAAPDWLYRWAQIGAPWLMLSALGPPLLYAVAQVSDGRGWPRRLAALPLLVLVGIGIALNNTLAVLKAALGLRQGFLRTPKYDVRRPGDAWVNTRYALGIDPLVWGELAMAAYAVSLVALRVVSWGLAPWLLLYAAGFVYVAVTGLLQALRRRRWRVRSMVGPGVEISA